MNFLRGFIRGFCLKIPFLLTQLVVAVQTLSDSNNNILKISRIFLDPQKLIETSKNCLKFGRNNVWDFQKLFQSSENSLKLLETFSDLRELFKTSANCLSLPITVWDFRQLLKTSKNCLKISRNCLTFWRTMSDFQNTSQETVKENSGPSGPLYSIVRKLFIWFAHSWRGFASCFIYSLVIQVIVAKVLLAIWEILLHDNNCGYISHRFSYKFVFILFLFFFTS